MSDVSDLSKDDAVYRTLLESTKAIPWKIDWDTKKFAYIGPQIEPLLGAYARALDLPVRPDAPTA